MLNSAEHEILPANKQKITGKYSYFFIRVGWCEIFYANEYENANISRLFNMYQQRKIHA